MSRGGAGPQSAQETVPTDHMAEQRGSGGTRQRPVQDATAGVRAASLACCQSSCPLEPGPTLQALGTSWQEPWAGGCWAWKGHRVSPQDREQGAGGQLGSPTASGSQGKVSPAPPWCKARELSGTQSPAGALKKAPAPRAGQLTTVPSLAGGWVGGRGVPHPLTLSWVSKAWPAAEPSAGWPEGLVVMVAGRGD